MPSVSQKQHNFMAWAASSKSAAKNADIPQSVAREFVSADKRKMEIAKHLTKGK